MLQIKIGDFGLARDVYSSDYYKASQNAKLPVKWMPLETLHDAVSNERTDVVRNISGTVESIFWIFTRTQG